MTKTEAQAAVWTALATKLKLGDIPDPVVGCNEEECRALDEAIGDVCDQMFAQADRLRTGLGKVPAQLGRPNRDHRRGGNRRYRIPGQFTALELRRELGARLGFQISKWRLEFWIRKGIIPRGSTYAQLSSGRLGMSQAWTDQEIPGIEGRIRDCCDVAQLRAEQEERKGLAGSISTQSAPC